MFNIHMLEEQKVTTEGGSGFKPVAFFAEHQDAITTKILLSKGVGSLLQITPITVFNTAGEYRNWIRDNLIASALKKLTPEERDALGYPVV
ncbi:hypothetical protein KBA63_04185 [Candidatus Woesebacteria bacterium]|nr:hypothetical protein [Candidatus Woesebacteria bacterium]